MTVVQRIDPTGSNPVVQANAALGFQMGVVLITADEYENTLALDREARASQRHRQQPSSDIREHWRN